MKYDGAIRFDLARVIPADAVECSGAQTARVIVGQSTATLQHEVWSAELMKKARQPMTQVTPRARPLKQIDLNTPADGWAGILAAQVAI
jgi:hypothetical protein